MTSEVVVMNSLAVALAADSAATVTDGHEDKIYNSANKLFMLSKHQPVGIMVHNNSSLLGIPWETIIKTAVVGLPDVVINAITDLTDEQKISWLNKIRPQSKEAL